MPSRIQTNKLVAPRRAFTLLECILCIAILGVLLALLASAVQGGRAVTARLVCAENLRQMGLAFQGFHDARSALPPGCTHPHALDPVLGPALIPYPLLNWGARLLPSLEQGALFTSIEAVYASDPDVTGPELYALGQSPLKGFRCPADHPIRASIPPHMSDTSNYLGVSGYSSNRRDGLLFLNSAIRLAQATDGTSNTLLVGERPINELIRGGSWLGGWGRNPVGDAFLGTRETAVSSDICPDYPYPYRRGDKSDPCSAYHFWSLHPGGANFLFADGSVRFLAYSANDMLPALATRDGGEPVSF